MPVSAIVLAAGEGTRMRSTRPKPLHLICGRPMVMHVIHSLSALDVDRTVVVVGHGAELVTKKVQEQAPSSANVTFVEQTEQRGTGHAAIVGLTAFPEDDLDDTSTIVILPGDAPLLQASTIEELVGTHEASGQAATLLTARMVDPTGYGRIIRAKDGRVLGIVEQRDGTPDAARDRRGVHEHLRVPSRSARAEPAADLHRQRAVRVLPDRCDRRPGRDGTPDRHRRGRRAGGDPGRQRSLAARAGRA